MKKKSFNCVKLQHQGAEGVRKATGNMTLQEQIAYWQDRTAELRNRQGRLAHKRKSAST